MNVVVRTAAKEDLPEIVSVHMECFPDYFSTKMGKKILASYYGKYLEFFSDLFFVVCDTQTNNIVGLANGYIEGETDVRSLFVSENKIKLALRLLTKLLLFDKVVWKKAIGFIKAPKKTGKKDANQTQPNNTNVKRISLLSICVKGEYRGSDAAAKLIENFDQACVNRGMEQYALSVFPDNFRAIAFYKKMGFEILKELEQRIIFVKKLVK